MSSGSNGSKDNNNDDSNGPRSQKTTTTTRILDKKMQDQLRQRRDERLFFERFQNAATNGLNRLSLQVEETGNGGGGTNFTMGEEEKRMISTMNGMGLKEGVIAGLTTFLVLRRGPVYITRWVSRRRLQQQQQQQQFNSHFDAQATPPPPQGNGGYQLSDPTALSSNNPFQRAAAANLINPGGGFNPRTRMGFIARSVWFVFDVTLSLMMGASISMAYTDTEKIRKQILEIPLIPGRSLTADALCDDVVQELVKVQEEKDPTYERLRRPVLKRKNDRQHHVQTAITPASYYLDGIVQFCENCQRRRYVEKSLRHERGLEPGRPVEIPPPGVDRNGPRLVVNTNGQEMVVYSNNDYNSDFQTHFGSHDDMDWADDFGTDSQQDDQDRT